MEGSFAFCEPPFRARSAALQIYQVWRREFSSLKFDLKVWNLVRNIWKKPLDTRLDKKNRRLSQIDLLKCQTQVQLCRSVRVRPRQTQVRVLPSTSTLRQTYSGQLLRTRTSDVAYKTVRMLSKHVIWESCYLNFRGLVLGCIETKFCNQSTVGKRLTRSTSSVFFSWP